ncbi:membrane protein [Bacillus mycoides]|nr:membrane protein [Bacillus mycoides]
MGEKNTCYYISACILFLVSFLHVYWDFGGKWRTSSVIPTKSGKKAFLPRGGMTLFIVLLLSMAAIILLHQANVVHFAVPHIIVQTGSWICMIVFFIRVIGEFHYLGIFKRKKIPTLLEWILFYIFLFVFFYLLRFY